MARKNNKGFTLVELLAVIVVLAIIALIGYTIVGDVISGAQESADKENVREYARSVRLAITSAQMNGETVPSSLSGTWLNDNVEKTGNEVVCNSVTDNNGTITLSGCSVGGSEQKYCYNGSDVTICSKGTGVKLLGTTSGVGTKTINLFNVNDIYEKNGSTNYYIIGAGSSGNLGEPGVPSGTGVEWRASNFIRITKDTKYHFNADYATASAAGVAWYDESKSFISGISSTGLQTKNGVIEVTGEAAYLRVSWRIDTTFGGNANWEKELQLVEGSCTDETCPDYEPYGYKIELNAEDESGNKQGITVYIGDEQLNSNDYLEYDGTKWIVVRNGVSSDPVDVKTEGDTLTGEITYTSTSGGNIVYNYE